MVPVITSKAQRMLEVSVAGNLMILEKTARRWSGGCREILPASVTTASVIVLPMSQLYFYGISCCVRKHFSYPKGSKHLP